MAVCRDFKLDKRYVVKRRTLAKRILSVRLPPFVQDAVCGGGQTVVTLLRWCFLNWTQLYEHSCLMTLKISNEATC